MHIIQLSEPICNLLLYFSGMFFSLNKQASNQTISSEFIEVPTVTLI